jgi:hypothetical protein
LRASGMTRSVMTDAANREAKVNRYATYRVKVPMETLMTGTPSRTARVSAARQNLKEVVGKLPVRGTRTAYEATIWRARGRIDSKPDVIQTGSAYMRRIYGRKVARLTLRDLPFCLRAKPVARQADGAAEVRRGHSSSLNRRGTAPAYWERRAELFDPLARSIRCPT